MPIRFASPQELLAGVVEDLGLPATASEPTVIAAIIRRICSFIAPCSRADISRVVVQTLRGLISNESLEPQNLKGLLEQIIVGGDLVSIESSLSGTATDDPSAMICAPPSFVIMGRCIFLFGIANDDAAFLPSALASSVQYDGVTRLIRDADVQGVSRRLIENGLREVTTEDWLGRSSKRTPKELIAEFERMLKTRGVDGDRPDITILRHPERGLSYRERWSTPSTETGLYVGRTPQAYGEPLWHLVRMDGGRVSRSLRLPTGRTRDRACDQAWHFQLAKDADEGAPANFSLRRDGDGILLRVYVPLPLQASRRLIYLAGARRREQQYGTYWLPTDAVEDVTSFLKTDMWLVETDI